MRGRQSLRVGGRPDSIASRANASRRRIHRRQVSAPAARDHGWCRDRPTVRTPPTVEGRHRGRRAGCPRRDAVAPCVAR
eukprot:scaffold126345_cov24-Phaeocystis_antarctica.AAC.1